MRGGVSQPIRERPVMNASSPRAWGCFFFRVFGEQMFRVFPTCVGVFLLLARVAGFVPSLPHVRGGVSILRVSGLRLLLSSPRAWGCFQQLILQKQAGQVFPTCVGVFLCHIRLHSVRHGLPHVRGGVSTPASYPSFSLLSSPRAWGCF